MKAYKVLKRVDHVKSNRGWNPGDTIVANDMPADLNIEWLLKKKAVEEIVIPDAKETKPSGKKMKASKRQRRIEKETDYGENIGEGQPDSGTQLPAVDRPAKL